MEVTLNQDDKDKLMKEYLGEASTIIIDLMKKNMHEPSPVIRGISHLQKWLDGASHAKVKEMMYDGMPYNLVDGVYYFDKAEVVKYLFNRND